MTQKSFSVLDSLLKDKQFLKLSDTQVLTILNENDQVRIPQTTYECSIKCQYKDIELIGNLDCIDNNNIYEFKIALFNVFISFTYYFSKMYFLITRFLLFFFVHYALKVVHLY